MCSVSVIASDYLRNTPHPWQEITGLQPFQFVSQDDFKKLQDEIRALRELLMAAVKFDRATGQPDCEQEDKVGLLRKIGKAMGVDLDSVLKPQAGGTV